jgi:hypothetical protein
MRIKMTIGIAALALATAFAAVPASAQQSSPGSGGSGSGQTGTPGYAADGSVISIPRDQHQARGQNKPTPYFGRNPNDGGSMQ